MSRFNVPFILILVTLAVGTGAFAQSPSAGTPAAPRKVSAPPTASAMAYPQSLFVDSRAGNIWVADFDNNRILRFDVSSLTSVDETPVSLTPESYYLGQNYPNPFNPGTTITFATGKTGPAAVRVYDMLGREVATLFDGVATARTMYRLPFDASNLPSGVYFYTFRSAAGHDVRKMGVVK
jgi:hypothetical protein